MLIYRTYAPRIRKRQMSLYITTIVFYHEEITHPDRNLDRELQDIFGMVVAGENTPPGYVGRLEVEKLDPTPRKPYRVRVRYWVTAPNSEPVKDILNDFSTKLNGAKKTPPKKTPPKKTPPKKTPPKKPAITPWDVAKKQAAKKNN